MSEDTAYIKIMEAIDQGPLTAPKGPDGKFSNAFIDYLKLLYEPEEAELVKHLKMANKFTSATEVSKASGRDKEEVKKVLDSLAKKTHIIGMGEMYAIPIMPLLLNVHQFREKLGEDDLKAGELYQEFFVKEGFYKYYESSEKGTPLMRVIPVNRTLDAGQKILDSEEAHKIIDACTNLTLVPCPCRTRTEKMGKRGCKENNPIGFCIMTEASAMFFQAVGIGKKVTHEQAKKYFDEMQELGLVGATDNYADKNHTVICLCCSCCCSQTRGRTRWDNPYSLAPSNFVAESGEECILCGNCEDRCMFEAITLDEDAGRAIVDAEKCLGCGLCTMACDQEAMRLKRVERSEVYANSRELFKKIAIENREGK